MMRSVDEWRSGKQLLPTYMMPKPAYRTQTLVLLLCVAGPALLSNNSSNRVAQARPAAHGRLTKLEERKSQEAFGALICKFPTAFILSHLLYFHIMPRWPTCSSASLLLLPLL
jgi:hypothetical protein